MLYKYNYNYSTPLRPEDRSVPEEVAVKVFKTTLNEFKNRDTYIREDYRFKGRYRKQNSRQLVQLWAEKEMHNLKRWVTPVGSNYIHTKAWFTT